jgi:hypothetical protein
MGTLTARSPSENELLNSNRLMPTDTIPLLTDAEENDLPHIDGDLQNGDGRSRSFLTILLAALSAWNV